MTKGAYSSIVDISERDSYLIPNAEVRGIGAPYVQKGSFFDASKPFDPTVTAGSSITLAAIPSPIANKWIHLPDGSVSAPGLAFASETNSGRYRIGSNNIGESINSTLVYDWNATRLKLATGYLLYVGASANLQANSTDLIAADGNSTGFLSASFRNTNATGAAWWGTHNDVSNAVGIRLNGSTHSSIHSSGLLATVGAGFLYMGAATASSTGNNALIIVNTYADANSPIIFGTRNAEVMRIASTSGGQYLGIATTTPRRKLDVLDTSAAQMRLTYTDNSVYSDLQTDSSGRLNVSATGKIIRHVYDASNLADFQISSAGVLDIIPTGNQFRVARAATGATLYSAVVNSDAAANSSAVLYSFVAATTSGDPYNTWVIGSTSSYSLGIDNSVSGDPFVLCFSASSTAILGTGNLLSITSGGLATWSRSDSATTPTHDLIQSSTGDSAIRFAIGSTTSWAVGIDNSVTGDPLVFSYAASGSAALGTGNVMLLAQNTNFPCLLMGATAAGTTEDQIYVAVTGGYPCKIRQEAISDGTTSHSGFQADAYGGASLEFGATATGWTETAGVEAGVGFVRSNGSHLTLGARGTNKFIKFYTGASGSETLQMFLDTSGKLQIISTGAFEFSSGAVGSASDVILVRDAANVLGQRNGTNAQELNVYNTWTSSTNFETCRISWKESANVVYFGTVKGSGGGTARELRFMTNETDRGGIGATTGNWDITNNLAIGTTTFPSAGGGKVLVFGDNAAQPTMGSNTAGFYGYDSGSGTVEAWCVDEAGNDTQLSPHDKDGNWYFNSVNRKTGRRLKVHMERLFKYLVRNGLVPPEFVEETNA